MNGDARIDQGLERATSLIHMACVKFEIDAEKLDWENAERFCGGSLLARNECRVFFVVPFRSKGRIGYARRSKRCIKFLCVLNAWAGEWSSGRVRMTVPQFLGRPAIPYEFEVPSFLPNWPNVIVHWREVGGNE